MCVYVCVCVRVRVCCVALTIVLGFAAPAVRVYVCVCVCVCVCVLCGSDYRFGLLPQAAPARHTKSDTGVPKSSELKSKRQIRCAWCCRGGEERTDIGCVEEEEGEER